ncbi:MAG: hypothetical protein ACFFCV_09810 [Promethearchaeota archaeon]
MRYCSQKEIHKNRDLYKKAYKIKSYAILIIFIILFQVPIVNITNVISEDLTTPKNIKSSIPIDDEEGQFSNSTEEKQNIESLEFSSPPEDDVIHFSNSPDIVFDINYFSYQDKVQLLVNIRNNLSSSITLLNLWIQVNKSDPNESILITSTNIIDGSEKLSLSTFENFQYMIFHIKLYEGEIIEPEEEYIVRLVWIDPDDIVAQYNPNLLNNDIADDIEAYFEYSTDQEESQLFPLIEREFYRFRPLMFCVDFRITNLMSTDLTVFNFTYVKFKDFITEEYIDLRIESPFLTSSEISIIVTSYCEFDDRIEYYVSFNQTVLLHPNEWFKILTKWAGVPGESSIGRDLIIWNTGEDDPFNFGYPFYDIGDPFHPILSPAEPIMDIDYDSDGLRNKLEIIHGLNPYIQDPWLTWQSLRSNYFIDAQYSKDLELGGKIGIVIPTDYSDNELVMNVQSLGEHDTLSNIDVNNEIIFENINTEGEYTLANPANDIVYTIKFRVSHDNTFTPSNFSIKFFIGSNEIIDLSSFFKLDSDGDGLIDELEENPYDEIPDTDNDGIIDGSDVMPFTAIDCTHTYGISTFDLPVYDSNSEIGINVQIKPTENDYTEIFDYRENELSILPGLRVYGLPENGDHLPDNSFSIDNGYSGLISLVPLHSYAKEKDYTWARMLTYKSDNLAKSDRQIRLKFRLVWLIFEYDTVTKQSKLLHIYNNNDLSYTVQGVSVTESQATNVVLGLVGDGSDYRKTGMNAELAAYLQVANMSYNPNDISSLEFYNSSCIDISDLNNTRDNLRNSILTQKNLDIEETYFIYLTYGYSLTYSFESIINEFGYDPTTIRLYTDNEIDQLYSRPEMSFIGTIATQLLRDKYIEFIEQIAYGIKNTSGETIRYSLQFSKYKYVGSASDEIYHLEGIRGDENIYLFMFDFNEKDNLMKSDSGRQLTTSWNLPIMSISLSGTIQGDIYNTTGLYDDIPVLGYIFNNYLDKYEGDYAIGQIPIKLAEIGVFVGTILEVMGKLKDFSGVLGSLGYAMGVFSITFGALRLAFGIDQINQGAFKTGMAESFRGGLAIISGVLAFLPANPATLVLVALVIIATLADWIASLFGYDLWGELYSWLGVEDANPNYEILTHSIGYSSSNLQQHASFRVGDEMSFYVKINNIGNTKLWFGVQLDLGDTGSPGTRKEIYTNGRVTGLKIRDTTATDTFDEASPLTRVTINTDISWSFYLGSVVVVVWYPPWIVCKDFGTASGGPYYSEETVYFDMPVMPTTLEEFISMLRDGSWFEGEWTEMLPEASVTPICDEIIPMTSEALWYDIDIHTNSPNTMTYNLYGSSEEIWDYTFYEELFPNNPYLDIWVPTSNITIDQNTHRVIRVLITPTTINPLTPGTHTTIVRIQHEDASAARTNAYLDYEIVPLIDFEVSFDPILLEGLDVDGGGYLPYFINVTNTGNLFDKYTVEILDLDQDLFDLYLPIISAYPLRRNSSLIVFYIPWGKIVFPGQINFKIKVSSHADPSLIKMFNCILDIQEYHRMSFFVEEASLTLTDSDIFNYNLHLTNFGNVEVPFDISYTTVDFANTSIPQNSYMMIPGQYKNFNLTMIPFELGNDTFTITATTPYISKIIEAYIKVIDDDILPPWFEHVIIKDNCFFLNISFLAFDEVEWHSDDIGIANISIYVDDELIHNYLPNPYETEFNFTFTNDWIMEYGNHTIRIEITDADNDRPNDALTTILEATFEVTPDEMMEYILWELSELEDYIEDVLPFCFNRPLLNHIHRAQCKVWWALYFYNFGCESKSVLLDMLAKASLEFFDMFQYVLLRHDRISEEICDFIMIQVHRIRDHLSLTMGAIVGTEIALEIADIIVEISQFVDDFVLQHCFCVFMSIQHHLRCVIGELEFVLYLMTKDYVQECCIVRHISYAICKLELTQKKIECLEKCGVISEEYALMLIMQIDDFIAKLNNLDIFL